MSERISIVVPVRDGADYLGAAIESLLTQLRTPDEVIVVDDGSRDGSAQIAAGFEEVSLVQLAAAGPAAARNAGVALATGDLLGFLDADDAALPNRLALQAAALAADPAADACVGLACNVPDRRPGIPDRALAREPVRSFALGTLLLRRAAFDRIGPFDASLASAEGVDWVARARRGGLRFAELDEVVLLRRDHGENFSASDRSRVGYLQLARAAIARQRAEPGA